METKNKTPFIQYAALFATILIVCAILLPKITVSASEFEPYFDPGTATVVTVANMVEIGEILVLLEILMEFLGETESDNSTQILEAIERQNESIEFQNEFIEAQFILIYVLLGFTGIWFVFWLTEKILRMIWYHLIHIWL
jgi:hypothetical protein